MAFTLTQQDILYEDSDLLAVNKPAGLLSVPGLSEPDNLLDAVIKVKPNARVVHRLDMPTSGIILYAMNSEAQRNINKQFENRHVQKTYQASVQGILRDSYGCIDAPMICDWENRPRQKIDWLKGKKAVTHYRLLAIDLEKNVSTIELYPHTGRSHQLRLHLYFLGYPIIGDGIYNNDNTFTRNHFDEKKTDSARLHLHAKHIVLKHPAKNKMVEISSDVPF